MGADHVVGLVAMGGIVAGVVAIVMIVRSGPVLPPAVVHPLCADCGHPRPEHSQGRITGCHHLYGHHTWNNDSYGSSQRRFGERCDCSEFRHQGSAT